MAHVPARGRTRVIGLKPERANHSDKFGEDPAVDEIEKCRRGRGSRLRRGAHGEEGGPGRTAGARAAP